MPRVLRQGLSRRRFLATGSAAGAAIVSGGLALPSLSRAADRPTITHGLQSGDPTANSGVVWARVDRPCRLYFDVSTSDSFRTLTQSVFVDALPEADFTATALIENLPSGQDIFYRVRARDLGDVNVTGEPVTGRFRTAPLGRRDVRFVWTPSRRSSRISTRSGSSCRAPSMPAASARTNWTTLSGLQPNYVKAPEAGQTQNLSPSIGLQFFGLVRIDGQTAQMTVVLKNVADADLYRVTLDPVQT